jgi:hypothetical protein
MCSSTRSGGYIVETFLMIWSPHTCWLPWCWWQ